MDCFLRALPHTITDKDTNRFSNDWMQAFSGRIVVLFPGPGEGCVGFSSEFLGSVLARWGLPDGVFIYKQIWKSVDVERWAIQAQEVRHDKTGQSKEKHFAWLCLHEGKLTTNPDIL